MEEFRLAHHKLVHKDSKYLIAILLEPLDIDALPRDLQMYLQTYATIDATKIPRNIARYVLHFVDNTPYYGKEIFLEIKLTLKEDHIDFALAFPIPIYGYLGKYKSIACDLTNQMTHFYSKIID